MRGDHGEKGPRFQQMPLSPESGQGFVQQKEHPEMWQKPNPSIFLNVDLMIRASTDPAKK